MKPTHDPGIGWRGRLMGLVILLALALLIWLLSAGQGQAAPLGGHMPPATIWQAVALTDVYCAGPCCCAHPWTYYQGHLYDSGVMGYCKWFRPLRNGDVVTLRLYLVR